MTAQTKPTEPTGNLDTVEKIADPFELHVADRCDQCGAQAFVAAAMPHDMSNPTSKTTTLLFCAHHAREHGPKIADFIVADTSASLYGHNRAKGEDHA